MKNLTEMTIAELYAALKKSTAATVAEFAIGAAILHELWGRGEVHPLMRQGPYRWHKEISAKRLSPMLALTIGGGHTALVRKMFDLPLDKQDAFANGDKIIVAVHDSGGKIIAGEQTITELDGWMYEIVFNDGMVRTFEQQKRILSKRAPDVRRSSKPVDIRADVQAGEIVCGQMRFKPSELAGPLKQLGFKVERIKTR